MERWNLTSLLLKTPAEPSALGADAAHHVAGQPAQGLMSFLLPPDPSVALIRTPLDPSGLFPEIRVKMRRLMQDASPQSAPFHSEQASASQHISFFEPTITALVRQIREDLENNPSATLALNRSRREAIVLHLERLSGASPTTLSLVADSKKSTQPGGMFSKMSTPPGTRSASPLQDAGEKLKKWLEGPRTPAQQNALEYYYEEVALIAIGQAILLKGWSDRGVRNWRAQDLVDLNATMNGHLRRYVPIDREGWQVHQRNLYSWYQLTPRAREAIWNEFSSWRIVDEGPELLVGLLRKARQIHSERSEAPGYDERFFTALWHGLSAVEKVAPIPPPQDSNRKRSAFTPTLRDGSVVRTGPVSMQWIALDSHPFSLMIAELAQLWWGPAAPPLWTIGNGLEVHARDQLTLGLGSPKPSLIHRIADIESCDVAFVLEENAVRAQGRSADAATFRAQVESLPYFKKLRDTGTSLGDLQACVGLSKLRPGGLMWFAREEKLSQVDGTEALSFLLNRGTLLCEWDLSNLQHSLPRPANSRGLLFPKYLYLFQRDVRTEVRGENRPFRIVVQGQIKSHIEIPAILENAIASFTKKLSDTNGHWKIHLQQNPVPQKEWAAHWPDSAGDEDLRELDLLKNHSAPLGSIATVRPRSESSAVHGSLKGFWVAAGTEAERKLVTSPLATANSQHPQVAQVKELHQGFMILVSDETAVAPLRAYLESPIVCRWLDHHVERKGVRWLLKEQDLKWIPIPKAIFAELNPADEEGFALPLPGDWERLAADIAFKPQAALESLKKLPHTADGRKIRAALFVRSARAVEHVKNSQSRLFSLVSPEGQIHWSELLKILPMSERIPLTVHPMVRMSGVLPLQIPILNIARVKTPNPGILLTTESGLNCTLSTESTLLTAMIWEQLSTLKNPTWSEIVETLRLPRRLELAETTAADVLRLHGEQTILLRGLNELQSQTLSLTFRD